MNETPAIKQKIRCAIYTRKSTEEGLEQAFNSLECPTGGLRGLRGKPEI